MIHVVDIKNPFDILEGHTVQRIPSAESVWHLLEQLGWTEIKHQITVTIGNTELPLEAWDSPIPDGAHIGISPKIEGGVTFVIVAIVAIVSVVVALSFSIQPPGEVKTNEVDPVFSLKGQTNQVKLNQPIEASYGDVRHWPSQAALSYNKYINNNAWQYTLLCAGHGEYEINEENRFIEDTPVSDFTDVEVKIYQPYEKVDLFRDNVETSTEVGTIELYGENEDDYPENGGWFTAVANSADTLTDLLEFDVTFPRGLYRQSKKGNIKSWSVSLEFEFIEIDFSGNEIGDWQTLRNISKTKSTVQPLRYTYAVSVPEGRYKVRGRRSGDASSSASVGDTAVWESLRAYLPNVGTYGNVTMIAVKARATANLNDQSARQFNFRGVRKLPVWENGSWTAPVATRNPVWAFCDIFRSAYGARLSDRYLHLESLAQVAAQLEVEEKWFDWVYDTEQTVWAAALLCTTSFRAIPLMDIARIYVQEDRPKPAVQHLFNAQNIIAESFELETSLPKTEDIDGITIEYTDYTTWKVETVDCMFPGSEGIRLETVTLPGVTDRNRAYREGMYMLAVRLKQRQQVTLRTGVEGFTSTHSDLVKVQYDTFNVDGTYGGAILYVAPDRRTVQLDQEVEVTDGDHMTVRGKDGTPYGPYLVEQGPSSDTVSLTDADLTHDIAFGDYISDPLFVIGPAVEFCADCTITALRPSNDGTVEVATMLYVPEIYDYDDAEAPPLADSGTPIDDVALPVVTGVDISFTSGTTYLATWNAATGSQYYVIQTSPDELDLDDPLKEWQDIGTSLTTSFEATLVTDTVYIRVAGVNTGQGPWAYYSQYLAGATRATPEGVRRGTPSGAKRIIQFT